MKRWIALMLVLALALGSLAAAEGAEREPMRMPEGGAPGGEPPEMPEGGAQGEPPEMPEGGAQGEPPEMPEGGAQGEPPEMPEGEMPDEQPPERPEGGAAGGAPQMPGGMGGQPGGPQEAPESYAAVYAYDADDQLSGAIESTGADESAVLVTGGKLALSDAAIVRNSADSSGGNAASFYGVGAAVLATGGEIEASDLVIDSDANGGAGAFAYGDGMIHISDSEIETSGDTSGGIHVAGGGTLVAENLDVLTHGESSAAIRSDRGGGSMRVIGGSYTTTGSGSPAVYVTADIDIRGAQLAAEGSEALCLEGKNSVRLTDCELSGNQPDLSQNDNSWTVIVYQSMSGDAEEGEGSFEMRGGRLISRNGGLFYTTNIQSEFVLEDVEIEAAEDCEYFLRCTGNANARGWGAEGANGAVCSFTAIGQAMDGDVVWDSISELTLLLREGSVLTGAVIDDESCAGEGGDGACEVRIDADSRWIVTGDSCVTRLYCAGEIVDADGNAVTIAGEDGTVYVQGESACTVTVAEYAQDAGEE